MNWTRLIALFVSLLASLLAGCGGDEQEHAAAAEQPPVAPSDESPQPDDSLSTEATAALAVMEDMIVYARTPEFQGQLSSFTGDPLQVDELKGLLDEELLSSTAAHGFESVEEWRGCVRRLEDELIMEDDLLDDYSSEWESVIIQGVGDAATGPPTRTAAVEYTNDTELKELIEWMKNG